MSPDDPTAAATKILLTGRPGIGKTTVIKRLVEELRHLKLGGFHTEEVRVGGQRQGFRATTLNGPSTVLAHVSIKSRRRVGRYGVDVEAFEQLVLPELARAVDLMLIDEIGKMECFSSAFVSAVRRLLESPTPVVATVALSGRGLIAEVKSRPDIQLLQVTRQDRDDLPTRIAAMLTQTREEQDCA